MPGSTTQDDHAAPGKRAIKTVKDQVVAVRGGDIALQASMNDLSRFIASVGATPRNVCNA